MNGHPPPLGPYVADVGQNPNIIHEQPPPPIDVVAGGAPAVAAVPTPGVVVGGPPVVGVGAPFGMGMGMGLGLGLGGLGMPFGGFGPPVFSAGLLEPPRPGFGLPGLPFVGPGAGGPFPPPPPGLLAGGIAPFAPGLPLWNGGGAVGLGGIGLGLGGIPPFGMGMGMGWGLNPPAPGARAEAVAPAQPEQADITSVPGGCPPGVTHVEAAEHTIVHLLKTEFAPWLVQMQPILTESLHIASSTGINRFITVCNNNQDAEGFAVSECIELGNGMWEKGQTFVFNDAISRVLTMKDAGWDNQRNRPGGRSLHVYLHRV
ncbi:hypothetical protein BS50DRAFT_678433 [Corynespora cassiicola Philippines]|uniref:Uncharacterized protein n=1 Tax=Corynespora cassiicola Philippines TaxID=1448308 RepID=A0A2T2NFT0_CORCC|nr:hypothetical protein BS50DRAFT_678433 [Corynespora cassiicola Philippines]